MEELCTSLVNSVTLLCTIGWDYEALFCFYSVFTGNNAPGGTLGAGFIHIDFSGVNVFSNNLGPGLRV